MIEKLKDEIKVHAVEIGGVAYRVNQCSRGECPFVTVDNISMQDVCTYPGSEASEVGHAEFPPDCPLKDSVTYKRVFECVPRTVDSAPSVRRGK